MMGRIWRQATEKTPTEKTPTVAGATPGREGLPCMAEEVMHLDEIGKGEENADDVVAHFEARLMFGVEET